MHSAQPGPDGIVCVERKKYIDKTEKDQLKECFVQNVTQCYYTYITEYSEAEQEKCEDFYWKTCKIVFKERVFNATTRMCSRPLIKKCDENNGYNNVEPKIVCETFFETACNTTHVVPAPGDEPLPGTVKPRIWNKPRIRNIFPADRNFYFINHLAYGIFFSIFCQNLIFFPIFLYFC